MSAVGRGQALSQEYMAQMAVAVGTLDLSSMTIRIRQVVHGPRYFLIKRRPATMSVKLVRRAIEFGVTSPANINAFIVKVVILSGEGSLRSFGFDYVPLLYRQRIVACVAHV